jgi:aspartokinase
MALLVRFAWPAHLADEAPGVSTMSGVTDSLINLARQVSQNPSEREMDVILSTGEQTTIALTAIAIAAAIKADVCQPPHTPPSRSPF